MSTRPESPEAVGKMSKRKLAQLESLWARPRSPKQLAHTKALHAARVGVRATAGVCANMSAAWWASEKQKAQLDAVHAGNVGSRRTPEACERIGAAAKGNQNFKGHKHTSKTLAKMAASWTPERRIGMSRAHKGRSLTAEHLKKLSGPNHHAWLGGISREPYAWTFNEELKEEVRRRDGYKCQMCNVPQSECEKKLPVHHIDYDKKNSDPVNLVTLCVPCHSRTNKNREYWMKTFQALAIERNVAKLGGIHD